MDATKWPANFTSGQGVIRKDRRPRGRASKVLREDNKWVYSRMDGIVLCGDEGEALVGNLIRAKSSNNVLDNVECVVQSDIAPTAKDLTNRPSASKKKDLPPQPQQPKRRTPLSITTTSGLSAP